MTLGPPPTVQELDYEEVQSALLADEARPAWTLALDGSPQAAPESRYAYLLATPLAKLIWKNGLGHYGDGRWRPMPDPWRVIQGWFAHLRRASIPNLPPFQGGLAGLFGYELAHTLERLPLPRFDEFQLPDLAVGLFDKVLALDRLKRRAYRFESPIDRERLAEAKLTTATQFPSASRPSVIQPASPQFALPEWPNVASSFTREAYLRAVQKVIRYIRAGDCFQVNLSQRLLAPAQDPLKLYARLRQRSPAPCSGLFLADDFAVISSSPERFIKLDANGRLETRPIKGTRPRRAPVEADAAAALELLYSDKDRAENVMIVDLLRNDLGKVSEYGSVCVETVCDVESYPAVHHLVSVVTGQLRTGLDGIDVLRAAFPGGSVTGAPKVRAMEIIAELEPTARGPYCGCLGWIGFDGAMDTSILIRTFAWAKGWLQFPVGGGIVADSDPEAEYEETLHKAAGMLDALAD